MLVPASQLPLIQQTDLWDHWIYWGNDESELAFPLGFGSLYNHSFTPNAVCDTNYSLEVLDFYAIRSINAGEELTINYNGCPDDRGPMWFDMD